MTILNLTQHQATSEQKEEGVIEPSEKDKSHIRELLTFDEIPTKDELENRARQIVNIAYNGYIEQNVNYAMIGGAPFFMAHLVEWLHDVNIQPLFAFSIRESIETIAEDGSIVKNNVFRHKGFVEG